MVDTLKLTFNGARLQSGTPITWHETIRSGAGPVSPRTGRLYGSGPSRLLKHQETGLRVYGDEGAVRWVECSLPRQVGPSNGHLLSSQAEMDGALAGMFERIREVADVGEATFEVKRLDLVQHLPVDPALLVLAYRDYRFPGIQALPRIWPEQSISWKGHYLEVMVYDKGAELKLGGRKVSRLEFRLRGEVLRREFGGEVTRLDFAQCYGVFRRLAERLVPKRLPRLPKIADLLAYVEQQGVQAMDYWLDGKSAPTVRTIRRQVSAVRLDYLDVNIMDHLPADRPPEPIHVGDIDRNQKPATHSICS